MTHPQAKEPRGLLAKPRSEEDARKQRLPASWGGGACRGFILGL